MGYMKYLVFSDGYGNERIYVFGAEENHADFASDIGDAYWKPVRGGQVSLIGGKLRCRGESISLGLRADAAKDSDLLNLQLIDRY